jgi:hypothetical protein
MSDADLDALLERMPQIADVVQKFSSESIQSEVFQALMRAFDGAPAHASNGRNESGQNLVDPADDDDDEPSAEAAAKPPALKAGRKAAAPKNKQSFSIDKTLDLIKGGDPSFDDFMAELSPGSGVEKCLVSVYWLERKTNNPMPVTVERVYTCFKHANWRIPGDLINTLQQAGTKGWLNTKKRDDLKVVVGGENHVEHVMTAKAKEKAKAS